MVSEQVTTTKRRRFFDDHKKDLDVPAESKEYGAPRGMTASAEVFRPRHNSKQVGMERRKAVEWQNAAWDYFDQIGELKYAFGLMSQIVSRALIYPAIVNDRSEVPVDTHDFIKSIELKSGETPKELRAAADKARKIVEMFVRSGQSELLRKMALNLSIPGDCCIIALGEERLTVASSSEVTFSGEKVYLKRSSSSGTQIELRSNSHVARIWRAHPRYEGDPDSSMLGILDQCEKVTLFDQILRSLGRSRLNAGVLTVPNGVSVVGGEDLATALSKLTVDPVESEASAASVTPLILQGPPDLADQIRWVEIGRTIDEKFMDAYDTAVDRMLAGVDLPKDIVSGLSDTKFANAVVIDDALYKAHIEPMLLLICDSLTSGLLRPLLHAQGVSREMADRFVMWYNPNQILTRPDRSQAANDGFSHYLISGEAWRRARGFSEMDKPSEEEILKRMAIHKTQIPQEIATPLIEAIHPEFFAAERAEARAEAGVPGEVSDLLDGGMGEENTGEEVSPPPLSQEGGQVSGGTITPGGTMPPKPEAQELL